MPHLIFTVLLEPDRVRITLRSRLIGCDIGQQNVFHSEYAQESLVTVEQVLIQPIYFMFVACTGEL